MHGNMWLRARDATNAIGGDGGANPAKAQPGERQPSPSLIQLS